MCVKRESTSLPQRCATPEGVSHSMSVWFVLELLFTLTLAYGITEFYWSSKPEALELQV